MKLLWLAIFLVLALTVVSRSQAPAPVTSPDGSPVSVSFAAPTVVTTCVPPSGSSFSVGDTLVTCTAAPTTFTVHVDPPLAFDWPSQVSYQGSFKLPPDKTGALDYPAFGLAYDDQRNGLFVSGNGIRTITMPCEKVGEITIPSVGGVASWLQPLTDITEGKCRQADVPGTPSKLGSYAVVHGVIYGNTFAFYDSSNLQSKAEWSRPSDLSVAGQVSDLVGLTFPLPPGFHFDPVRYTNAVSIVVPPAWQSALGGPILVGSANSNIAGGTSNGPDAFGYTPGSTTVQPLLYFPPLYALNSWRTQSDLWNGSTNFAGGFIVGGDLVYLSAQGTGPFCYGNGYPSVAAFPNPLPAGGACVDPEIASKGDHAYPYKFIAQAYHLKDLLANAAAGTPWVSRPYASWDIGALAPARKHFVLGVAYDWAGNRLFLSQGFADGNRPLIHVFQGVK